MGIDADALDLVVEHRQRYAYFIQLWGEALWSRRLATGETRLTAAEMRERLIGKATRDDEFRARLVADPKGAIETEWGVNLPDGFHLEVHEESSDTSHLVLPPPAKLSEADLTQVTGGWEAYDNVMNKTAGRDW